MNVTILVGNGFDLNLNLKTQYTDFIKDYCENTEGDNQVIEKFKKDIAKDCENWANAELAFGQYTANFQTQNNGAEEFCDCHEDFCRKLALYLKAQEKRLNWDFTSRDIAQAFSDCIIYSNLIGGLSEVERTAIRKSISYHGDGITYNFIDYNYTRALDKWFEETTRNPVCLGGRLLKDRHFENSLGHLYHIHGDVENNMVLGVNDESQISEIDIFENYEPEYKESLIKPLTNEMNGANVDESCKKLIEESNLIYVYGMSLGKTDMLWWRRIIDWLINHQNAHIIIYAYKAPYDQLLKRDFNIFCRKMKREFLSYYTPDKSMADTVLNRVHIDPTNIFEKLKAFAATEETINAVPETV